MAPATRSRQASGVNKKAPPPRRKTRTTKEPMDWDFMTTQDEEDGQNGHADGHHYNGSLVVASREQGDFDEDDFVNPVREMADRVGIEVEKFAEELDKFLDELPTQNTFRAVLDLVDQFKDIAKDAEWKLKKTAERERAQQLRKEWSERAGEQDSRSSISDKKKDVVKEMRQWQQEVDLWDLFRIVLECHHNPDQNAIREAKEDELRSMSAVNRYTPEHDVYRRFLVEDDLARWRANVKDWLQKTADHQESEIPDIMEELESRAGRGRGLWSSGWMDTRERIKGEKRLRSWPTTPGAALPHITRSDNNQLLVTTLDPDAPAREGRSLEKPDAYFERAMWIACWEMLRRGKSWEEVSQWCRERKESWRAISIGKAMSPQDAVSKSTWRHMCYLASQDIHVSDYEAAVYGLLGGSVNAVQRVSHTVDDTLFAYYNAALLGQFEQHLSQHYPERAAKFRRGPLEDNLKDPENQLVDLILSLRQKSSTSQEAVKPMKILQSYLMADDAGSMVHTLGYAIAHVDAARQSGENMIIHLEPFWPGRENQPEEAIALQPNTLRIATHIAILMRILDNEELVGDQRDAEENVYVAYIQQLRAAGKRDLIPTYAARLSVPRYVVTMARVLEDISSVSEQENMLALMSKLDMKTSLILNEQLLFLLNEHVAPALRSPRPLRMLEDVEETLVYPGQRIMAGFLPDVVTTEDDAILRAVQWYSIIKGHWEETFNAFALAVRKCLVAGKFACALSIVYDFPFDTLCQNKTYQTIHTSVNIMEHDGPAPNGEDLKWDYLRKTSRTYYELCTLVTAIKALADWRDTEADLNQPSDLESSQASKPDLKKAKSLVDEAMEPILTGNILRQPLDEDEAADLHFIRTRYIPEMIIAYNTVLHSAGTFLTRQHLIEAMDLSVTVADEKNHLSECFVEVGRMRELVKSFAITSKAMLILKGAKKWTPAKGKLNKEGKDLGIWEPGVMVSAGRTREVQL